MENPFLLFSPFFILNHLYAFIIFKMLIQFTLLGVILLKFFFVFSCKFPYKKMTIYHALK